MPKLTLSSLAPEPQYLELRDGDTVTSHRIRYWDDLSLQQQAQADQIHTRIQEIQKHATDYATGKTDAPVSEEEDAEHKSLMAQLASLAMEGDGVKELPNNIHAAVVDAFFTLRELFAPKARVRQWAWQEQMRVNPELASMFAALMLGGSLPGSSTDSLETDQRSG